MLLVLKHDYFKRGVFIHIILWFGLHIRPLDVTVVLFNISSLVVVIVTSSFADTVRFVSLVSHLLDPLALRQPVLPLRAVFTVIAVKGTDPVEFCGVVQLTFHNFRSSL